jgi:hypothetical protein
MWGGKESCLLNNYYDVIDKKYTMLIFVTHHQKCKKKPLQYHTGAKIVEVNY